MTKNNKTVTIPYLPVRWPGESLLVRKEHFAVFAICILQIHGAVQSHKEQSCTNCSCEETAQVKSIFDGSTRSAEFFQEELKI